LVYKEDKVSKKIIVTTARVVAKIFDDLNPSTTRRIWKNKIKASVITTTLTGESHSKPTITLLLLFA